LAPTIREQIYALGVPETVPEAAFEAYRSFVSSRLALATTEPLDAPTGAVSEKIKASVTVLEFVSQYVDLKPTEVAPSVCAPSTTTTGPALGLTIRITTGAHMGN
jgi:hypothetical protein